MDEERSSASCTQCGRPLTTRDDGDGSSSSTNADEPLGPLPPQSSSASQTQSSGIFPPPLSQTNMSLSRSSSRERLLDEGDDRHQRSHFNGDFYMFYFIYLFI